MDRPELHLHPTAAEAVAAVREWLADEVVGGVGGAGNELSYRARVAAHLLGVVERELTAATDGAWMAERLGSLGVGSEAELAAQVAAGAWDHRADELLPVLAAITEERLAVANPAYAVDVADDDPRQAGG